MRSIYCALVLALFSIVLVNTAHSSNPPAQKAKSTMNQNKTNTCSDDWVYVVPGKIVPLTSMALRFATCLRNAIKTDDRDWVAGHVLYPIKLTVEGQFKLIHNKGEFIKFYNEIIGDDIKQIAMSDSQWTVSKHDDGFMIGTGQIWIMALGPPNDKNLKAKFYVVTIQ